MDNQILDFTGNMATISCLWKYVASWNEVHQGLLHSMVTKPKHIEIPMGPMDRPPRSEG